MSQRHKTPRGVILTLVAGFGIGAITMASVQSGFIINKAYAQGPSVSAHLASADRTESLAELHNLDASFANLADFVAPSVVDIQAVTTRATNANGQRMPVREGEGSGFIIRSDGYIMTNDHVVAGADKVKVTMRDGREYDGKVMRAQDSDIAIVKIDAKDLPVLAFADSSELRPGQMVMAVGAPFGLENSVTFGHVSALGRATGIGEQGEDTRYYPDLIQTDASINMGNSGGPLVNVDGQIVGVNTAIYSPSGTSAGIGFAIPSNQAKFISDMLVKNGKITRSMIGLIPDNLKDYEKKDKHLTGGAVVSMVAPDGAAAKAGIQKGDIVTKIGTSVINSQLDLRNAMLVYAPSTKVPVTLIRGDKTITVDVTLEPFKMPEAPKQEQIPMQQFGNGQPFDFPDDGSGDPFGGLPKIFQRGQRPDVDQDVPAIRNGQAKLGVQVGDTTAAARKQFSIPSNVSGAVVMDVQPGSVGEQIGLQPGDVITELAGTRITNGASLTKVMGSIKWGDNKQIKFSRYGNGSTMNSDMTITFR